MLSRLCHVLHRPLSTSTLEKDGARILRAVQKRVETRNQLLSKPIGPHDVARARQIKELEPLHDAWSSWQHTRQALLDTLPLLHDPDPVMRALAADEHAALTARLSASLASFSALLVPPSRTRAYGALLELKPGVGGSEAALFSGDLLRVYVRYAGQRGWRAEGREGALEVHGAGAYDVLRWETGVHRVQRVPATEASGRVHTSTVAVIVLPLSEEAEPAADDELFRMEDVRVEVMRSRGAGGQHVNKTESAVRLTHVPTGVTVSMQDERSQHQNKRRAFQVLRARLLDMKLTREVAERRAARQSLVRTADRSEKIRTYNYAQDRVTDHRIGLSLMNLQSFMEGDGLQAFLDAMRRNWEEEMMEEAVSED